MHCLKILASRLYSLYKKAIKSGVKFTEEQLWDMDVDSEGNNCAE